MRRAILVSTDCRCAINWTLYSNLLEAKQCGPCSNRLDGYDVTTYVANYDIQLAKSADPGQMPHYAESHLGSHSLYYVPFMGHCHFSK